MIVSKTSAIKPMEDLVALLLETTTLKRVPRAGWLLRGVPHVESVADHSYSMAVLALALADVLNASGELVQPLDVGRVLVIAVLHDLGEARLTDLPGPAMRLIPADVKRQAERDAVSGILASLPSAVGFTALWREYEEGSTAEGRLARDADKLEMMVQCFRYERAGSRGLEEFWAATDQYRWHYALCDALYQHLKALRTA